MSSPTLPKFAITNNHLALLIAGWAAFTQVRDAIAAWALKNARQEALHEKVGTLTTDQTKLSDLIEKLDQVIHGVTTDVATAKGDVQRERERAYGAEEEIKRMLAELKIAESRPTPYPPE